MRGVMLTAGAALAVAGITWFVMQSSPLAPRGLLAESDAAFQEKYCQRATDMAPGLIVAQLPPERIDVDATIWSALSPERQRAFVGAAGCVNYGHPLRAGEHLRVVAMPAGGVLAEAEGANIRIR